MTVGAAWIVAYLSAFHAFLLFAVANRTIVYFPLYTAIVETLGLVAVPFLDQRLHGNQPGSAIIPPTQVRIMSVWTASAILVPILLGYHDVSDLLSTGRAVFIVGFSAAQQVICRISRESGAST